MNIAAYGGHDYVVRLCYNYVKVNLDEVMEWATGGHKKVVRLCQELGATDLNRAILWAVKGGHDNIHAPVS